MLLVDTNIWLIAADHEPARHREITTLLAGHTWAAPTPVIAESAWFILDRLGTSGLLGPLLLSPPATAS